jgi:hypothetical protein
VWIDGSTKNIVLRKVCGPTGGGGVGADDWKELHNEELMTYAPRHVPFGWPDQE